MKHKKFMENIVHGVFLFLGLITVAFVLLITVYLIIAGMPAIGELGLFNFLFGKSWGPTYAVPEFGILPFILSLIHISEPTRRS